MNDKAGLLSGPGIMIMSAVIFGFFGFGVPWNTTGTSGQFLLFVALLVWTLRVSAILFVVSAALTMIHSAVGNLLYSLVGGTGAGLFLVVGVMDIADDQHTVMPYAPLVLLAFAAWNGFGSWSSLRAVLAMHGEKGQAEGDAGA